MPTNKGTLKIREIGTNKGILGIPLFVKIPDFVSNKGKLPLFVFPYLDPPLYKDVKKISLIRSFLIWSTNFD